MNEEFGKWEVGSGKREVFFYFLSPYLPLIPYPLFNFQKPYGIINKNNGAILKKKNFIQNFILFFTVVLIILSIISGNSRNPVNNLQTYAEWNYDGDTITAILNHHKEKIRLIGIDCPEHDQKYGMKAKKFTEHFLGLDHSKKSKITIELDTQKRDKYGRLLAFVYNDKGKMLNAALLRNGLAVTLFINPNRKHREEFKKLLYEAKKEKLNIWNPDNPLKETPSEYRREHK